MSESVRDQVTLVYIYVGFC